MVAPDLNQGEKPGDDHLHVEKIKGVFSTQVMSKVGAGTTVRKTIQKTYWFVNEIDSETVEIQPLNINYVPSGPKREVSKDEFLDKFSPEPEFYSSTVYPKIREMNKKIAKGERHKKRGESFSAEMEFGKALNIDEENIRANFGLGLTYLERGEREKGNDIFERLVKLEATFEREHKHLFNDFGINLRKNNMFDQAVEYYARAIELAPNDENLRYNMARAYFAKDDIKQAALQLKEALKLNRNMPEALKFLAYMKKHGLLGG